MPLTRSGVSKKCYSNMTGCSSLQIFPATYRKLMPPIAGPSPGDMPASSRAFLWRAIFCRWRGGIGHLRSIAARAISILRLDPHPCLALLALPDIEHAMGHHDLDAALVEDALDDRSEEHTSELQSRG